MAGPNYVLGKGWIAGGAIRKFRAVELGAGEVVTECNALNDPVLGICQEEITAGDATNGRIANIQVLGISRCIAGAAIAIGDRVRSDSQGRMVTVAAATVGQRVVGVALQAAANAGEHVDVLLTPGTADVA